MAGRPRKTTNDEKTTSKVKAKEVKETKPKRTTKSTKSKETELKTSSKTEDVKEEMIPEDLPVSAYFDYVKGMKQETDSEHVKKMADACMDLLKKFEITGQKAAAKKAKTAFDVLSRDLKLYDHGITTYVHLDEVSKYLKKVQDHSVKIIEISNFPREIPDDVIEKYLAVKDLFDEAFVVFTDYTEKTEETDTAASAMGKTSTAKEVEQKRKEKDPILFGAIKVDTDNTSLRGNTYEKLYYIADWIDDYCDLTFDKLIDQMAKEMGTNPSHEIKPIETKEEFKKEAGL